MFIPKAFQITERSEIHQFIHKYGFGVIISSSLTATHLPFVLKDQQGEKGILYSHCAKANKHWQELENKEVLIIFSGPHSYISPSWYAKGPGVPTWNYTAVHAYGKVSLLNKEDTLQAVDDVVLKYEPNLLKEQTVLTNEYRDKLLSGIVGFKIEITRIEGQQKLGQQRSQQDQQGVYKALEQSNSLEDQSLALYMKKVDLGMGGSYKKSNTKHDP